MSRQTAKSTRKTTTKRVSGKPAAPQASSSNLLTVSMVLIGLFVVAVCVFVWPSSEKSDQTESLAELRMRLANERQVQKQTLQKELAQWQAKNKHLEQSLNSLRAQDPTTP